MDRENKRRKRKTHVIETRKHDEKRQQMNKCMSKKGHKEVTHACEK